MQLQFATMEKEVDINKVVKQHQEINNFLTGGFTVRGQNTGQEQTSANEPSCGLNDNTTIELEKIADEVRQCRKCDLGSLRTNAVPGEGKPNACIMFVGEGPGADEDAQGRPFV